MKPAQCGCDRLAEAAKIEDDESRLDEVAAAERNQREWRCPCAGFPVPSDGDPPLAGPCASVAEGVSRLTGFENIKTCPLWYARLPWVDRVCRARVWQRMERGRLEDIEPVVSGALVDAILAVSDGVNAREMHEHEERMAEAEELRRRQG